MDPECLRGRVSHLSFKFKTSGCKKITTSPYRRPAAIFLQPLVSNCLFISANFWRELKTSGCKKITNSLQYGLVAIYLQPLVSNTNSTEKRYLCSRQINNTDLKSTFSPALDFQYAWMRCAENQEYMYVSSVPNILVTP